jgi:predicted HicB family RNase H-like nuclease
MESGKPVRKNLYLDGELVAEAQAEADRRRDSLSDFVEVALREKLNRLRRPAPVVQVVSDPVEVQS